MKVYLPPPHSETSFRKIRTARPSKALAVFCKVTGCYIPEHHSIDCTHGWKPHIP